MKKKEPTLFKGMAKPKELVNLYAKLSGKIPKVSHNSITQLTLVFDELELGATRLSHGLCEVYIKTPDRHTRECVLITEFFNNRNITINII